MKKQPVNEFELFHSRKTGWTYLCRIIIILTLIIAGLATIIIAGLATIIRLLIKIF